MYDGWGRSKSAVSSLGFVGWENVDVSAVYPSYQRMLAFR